MSYDLELLDPLTRQVLILDAPHQMKGGTYPLGGQPEARLNITYNYAKHYDGFGKEGIRAIYGLSGAISIPILQKVADSLGDDVHENYWEPTEGNAKQALLQLIALARLRPDGIWDGD